MEQNLYIPDTGHTGQDGDGVRKPMEAILGGSAKICKTHMFTFSLLAGFAREREFKGSFNKLRLAIIKLS